MLFRSSSSALAAESKEAYDSKEIIRRIYASKRKVLVSRADWAEPKEMGIDEIIKEAEEKGLNLVFHCTPGPLLDMETDLTESEKKEWKGEKKKDLFGCTPSLQGLEAEYGSSINTVVCNINIQPSKDQCGPGKILAKRDLKNIRAISDPKLELTEEIGLPTIEVGDKNKKFNARLTIALMPKERSGDVFEVPRGQDGVTAELMKVHIAKIQEFFSPAAKAAASKSLTKTEAEI